MKNEGYYLIDHRASPGIPEEMAEKSGFAAAQLKAGSIFEAATQTCLHCSVPVVLNPLRTRERGKCSICNGYICDVCKTATLQRGYVHYTLEQVSDMVQSGRYTVSGSTSAPILVPVSPSGDISS